MSDLILIPAGGSSTTTLAIPAFFYGGSDIGTYPAIGSAAAIESVGIANRLQCILFYLNGKIPINKITVRVVTGSAATTANFGLYNSSGSLILDSGSMSTASSNTTVSATLSSTVTPDPDWYYFAAACTSTTPTVVSIRPSGNASEFGGSANQNQSRLGVAANSLSAGALPSSLGSIVANGSTFLPLVLFES